MTSLPPKEVLAKNLQKSHSSASLLLSSANLSWTPTTSAILVTPQPPVDRAVSPSSSESSKALTNEEIIQTLRLDSKTNSNQSIDVLEGFQTINLLENKIDENNYNKTNDSSVSAEKKLSLLNQLFSSVGVGDVTPYSSGHRSTVESIPPLPPPPTAPPQPPPPPPTEPPKGFVAKNYRIRGPLRVYDPNYGFGSTSPTPEGNSFPVPNINTAEVLPLNQSFYNPNEYLSTNPQTIATNDGSSGNFASETSSGQQLSAPIASEVQTDFNYDYNSTENSQQFSFVSETPNPDPNNLILNQNDWSSTRATSDPTYTEPTYYESMATAFQPVVNHWFYQKIIENKEVWIPFSMYDSYNLEQAFLTSPNNGYGVVIATDGGRFDVFVYERLRRPVYWPEVDSIVRRCSWFYKKEGHNRWAPYPEDFSVKLEDSYKEAVLHNRWNQKIELESETEVVVMHSQQSIYHYQSDNQMPDGWGQALENPVRPRLVHRGALDGIFEDIDEGEPEQIDHLVFLIHGIGEFCDFRFRSIVEVVDDFRSISLSQMRTHFKPYLESGQLGRIELLPISWHSALHGEETGIDDRLKQITLESIPKLRHFSNDTILDALFYTSPVYCQTIIDNVGQELNRLFALFCQRNANFCGTVALGGHSLGSLIVFDILAHQINEDLSKDNDTTDALKCHTSLGLGFPAIKYPTLSFKPSAFFAMGSPIPMFLTVRGVEFLSPDYRLPTCPAVYNIFHPYDPIAYRLEPMIYRSFKEIKPVLIPHHKGRKRMHLELKDSIARMGSDIKSKIYDSLKYTWNSINEFARAHKPSTQLTHSNTIDDGFSQPSNDNDFNNLNSDSNQDFVNNSINFTINNDFEDNYGQNISAGALNSGRRIDYVLQESPVEVLNEYLFAIRAHTCYWLSEDTALLILRELYGQLGYYTTTTSLQQQTIPSSASNLDLSSSFDLNTQQFS